MEGEPVRCPQQGYHGHLLRPGTCTGSCRGTIHSGIKEASHIRSAWISDSTEWIGETSHLEHGRILLRKQHQQIVIGVSTMQSHVSEAAAKSYATVPLPS